MKKVLVEDSIRSASSLLKHAVNENLILACLIKDGFSETRAKTILLWAKQSIK